ncbi:MAG: hypothetical protein AAFO74_01540 [Pseudomonadota bacterium]
MALVEKPDPRKKLILAGVLDAIIVIVGVALFITSGSVVWVFGAFIMGAAISTPLLISAARELKEQNSASG